MTEIRPITEVEYIDQYCRRLDPVYGSINNISISVESIEINLPRRNIKEIFSENVLADNIPSRITHVADIVGKRFGCERIFNTKSHREIYSVLLGHLTNLHDGKYEGKQGVCCSTLVGAKGIGKTACFKHFTILAKFVRPVILLYVSFNNILSDGSRLCTNSLARIIVEELARQGIYVTEDKNITTCERIIEALICENRKLLVLVDELDQLYKLDGNIFPAARSTIHDLVYFGNQPSGKLSVLVCGSTALMENLITTNSTDQIRDEYPLLKSGAINLNSTKYRTKRVYSTLPTDLKAIESIIGYPEKKFEENVALYRLVAYITGCSARNVERLLNDVDDSTIIGSTSPENSQSGANTQTNNNIALLRKEILKSLVAKNNNLMRQIFGTSTFTTAEIVKNLVLINWESQFIPLTFPEVEQIWFKLERKKKVQSSQRGDLCYYILYLTDRCWFTINGIRDSRPEFIYPFSFSSLGAEVMTSCDTDNLLKLIVESVQKFDVRVGETVSSPQFLGCVTPIVITTLVAAAVVALLVDMFGALSKD
eukprot:CAMPEP_0170062438 /NCGR_PEP_ID=MMETSP0019_2-20121128/3667_1 /TAXON_ID=98059 /ORGANISM="Dinobryon sp., Strain UTEXLB2267" /LENGTH=539 /DNA_ID=CAMNT_0010268591 /DNA_START=19 /DNA_END=1639 /DNA_ORIENTATION=+